MKIEGLLAQKSSAIVKEWFNHTIDTYPADSAQFLKKQKDPFANPVGATAKSGLEAVFSELIGGMDQSTLSDFLDPIIRMRAIQNFSPSQAVGFIFLLKKVIRKALASEIKKQQLYDELLDIESRIDRLSLLGFNIYMECKEKIFHIMEKEVKNKALHVFKQEGLLNNGPACKPEL